MTELIKLNLTFRGLSDEEADETEIDALSDEDLEDDEDDALADTDDDMGADDSEPDAGGIEE